MLEEASTLVIQSESVKTKQRVYEAFKNRFVMAPSDVYYLTSSTEPVDDHFFELLGQAKRIHKDCEFLLGSENQRLGLELMDQTLRNLNNAFKKLYNWIQKEFKILDLEAPHVGAPVRRALRVLAERPSLFQNCLDFFAEAREHTLSDAFHAALIAAPDSEGTRKGAMKPIEFSTHDPLRYIGDMLAWIHSATVSEQESLESLFIAEGDELAKGLKAGKESELWANVEGLQISEKKETTFDGRKALNDLVSRDMAGVSRTLKQRAELAIRNHEDPVVMYKTKSLLDFYESIFSKLVGNEAALILVTSELTALAFDKFDQLMADEVNQSAHESIPDDLSVPSFLRNALDRLSAILKTDSATVRTPSKASTSSTSRLLTSALIPFLDQCSDFASSLPKTDSSSPPANVIFQLNCLVPVQSQLIPHSESIHELVTTTDATISSLITELTTAQHAFFLQSSDVANLLSAIESSQADQPISKLPAFAPEALTASAQKLDDFLPEAILDGMRNLKYLADKKLAQQLTEDAAQRFCADFEVVENKLTEADEMDQSKFSEGEGDLDHQNKAENERLRDLYPRTLGEVRVLLS